MKTHCASRLTSSWSGPSYGVVCTPHVRHFIVHTRRAGHFITRLLNCGVRRTMAKRGEILQRWGFPHWQRHGVTLVAREDASACVERILESGCRFYGYDSFIVSGDTIQPVIDFSPDWSRGPVPSLTELRVQLAAHPGTITHYEFVFEDPT